jgi:O-acetylhomoserine/O-acetylserine sulfhydrylase-like pyridoxal-dependent enzyme
MAKGSKPTKSTRAARRSTSASPRHASNGSRSGAQSGAAARIADAGRDFLTARHISPRRKTSSAKDIPGLVREQLAHFGIDPRSAFGRHLGGVAEHVYRAHADVNALWHSLVGELASLDRRDRAARFAAQKFLCFQLAKVMDTLMNPFRRTYQSIVDRQSSRLARGPYPVFDNLTALFSAKPVITRTATYIYACSEWVDDAFQGKELMLEVYSRLLNPTNVSLANHIVDIEAGPEAHHYFAWNFNSGMAAIDAVLSHLVGYRDIILSSRNVYGGTYQLMHDWFAKPSNLDVAVEFFDGFTGEDFSTALAAARRKHADRLREGRQIYVYLESPCNPHGYVLDIPEMCRRAHAEKLTVLCDSTVGTPFLHRPLQRPDPMERPDFVIHSYTKDITGMGGTTAGCVIGRNERMFMGKHDAVEGLDVDGSARTWHGHETLFWNVYYIKGAFLDSDKAYEVLNGLHTLELRMIQKAVNTLTLAEVLGMHPDINVNCNAVQGNPNAPIRKKCLFLGLPAGLFTIDFEGRRGHGKPPFDRTTFKRFFDSLDPVFGHQVSLGQTNTVVLCPAITSHSEMSDDALRAAGIEPTTVRVAVGTEDPRTLIAHLIKTAELTLEDASPGFCRKFPAPDVIDAVYRKHAVEVHRRVVENLPPMSSLLT